MFDEALPIAFVLRHYAPYNQKIILFNRDNGKFQARISFNRKNNFFDKIGVGALIEYNCVPNHNKELIIDLKQIYVLPFALARDNILFLHHLLEICYFFIPFESCDNHKVFDLLIFLYQIDMEILKMQTQKLLLFRLFALLGLYPEQVVFHNTFFYGLITCSLEYLTEQSIKLPIERLLDMWLINCIESHPMVNSFKTIRFLKEVRVP